MHVAHLHAPVVAHDLPPLHRRGARLVRAHDQRADGAAGKAEVHVQQQLAGRELVPPHAQRLHRLADQVRHEVEVMHAVVQVEARVVRIACEVGRRRHVLAQEAGARPELGGGQHAVRDPVRGREALHEAHDHGHAARPRQVRQRLRVGGRGGRRLLDEDRAPRLHAGGGDLGVRLRPGCHADDVDAGVGEHVAPVARERRHAQALRGLGQAGLVDVAQLHQPQAAAGQLRQQHLVGVPAAADPCDAFHACSCLASARAARRKAALAASGVSSSSVGARHCASPTPRRCSLRRKGSSVIGPA